jgi:hypothetical protein
MGDEHGEDPPVSATPCKVNSDIYSTELTFTLAAPALCWLPTAHARAATPIITTLTPLECVVQKGLRDQDHGGMLSHMHGMLLGYT